MTELRDSLEAYLVGRYTIEGELGHGGMATVFLAWDMRHDRPVALKVFRPELGPALGERFIREIRVAAKLSHPHILAVHDSGESGGLLWYTMPVVDGESLRNRILREGPLPVEEAVRLARTVAEALEFAHSHGVVHRDIKPENILLFRNEAMVADFGIALAIEAAGDNRLTGTGFSLGTPAYMSPEQACAEPNIDGRTDIYSLGCVLYEMLAGEPPYPGPTPQAILARRLTEPPPRLRMVRDVPESLERTVHRALSRNPADRFRTAGDFARAMTVTETFTRSAQKFDLPALKPGKVARVVGALLLAAVLGLAWITYRATFATTPVATQVAVLPFSVPGSGTFEYLREGIVDLLSRNLDGAETLVAVDPGRVISTVRGRITGINDVDRGGDIARRLGAGQFVLGSVHAAGPQLRIQAQLYQQDSIAPRAVAQAAVEGDSTMLFQLVDQLSAQLLVGRGQGQGARLAQTAALTTRSLPALKVYLDAERNLRAGRFDSAVTGFQLAGNLDTSFALADYRLAVAAPWTGRMGLSDRAMERALSHAERLSERDSSLLSAFANVLRGAPDLAERQYRAILETYPDDLEARFQLANVLYTYNAPRGRPPAEALEHYSRVLDVDPQFLCPI